METTMEELKDLLSQITSKELSQAEKTFDSLMKVRTYDKIQEFKPEVAKDMFDNITLKGKDAI